MPDQTARHPLGLPPGSIRSILSIMITGLFATLLLLPASQNVTVPPFLYPLLSLLLVYVVAHGKTIATAGERPPLHLPHGTVPFLVTIGLIAAVSWKFVNDRDTLLSRLTPTTEQLQQWPVLLAALFGGFFFGRVVRRGPWNHTPMYQDLLAWVSLLCMLGLGIETLAVVFIHPTLPEGLDMHKLEAFLTAAVALYFGARS
jgi:hypothetical protein